MVSQSTQNYSSFKKSTWPHLLLVGQLGQTWSNLVKLVKNLYYFVRVIIVWNPPSDNAKSPPRGMAEPTRKKSKPKASAVKDSLLSNPKLAAGAISSILLESDVGRSKGLPVDEALALSFQGVASVSL